MVIRIVGEYQPVSTKCLLFPEEHPSFYPGNDLFDEISSGLQGEDFEEVDVDVEDDDSDFDVEEDEEIEECGSGKPLEESDDTDVDLAMEDEVPGESQGWGSLVGCHLWGHTESDTSEAT